MLMPLLKRRCAVFALVLVACCAGTALGAVLLPSQPTPASLAAFLQSCSGAPPSEGDQASVSPSCTFLAPNSTFTLRPGAPASLPVNTILMVAPATRPMPPASCCNPSDSNTPPPAPPPYTNVTTINTTTSPPELDLARLAPSSLVVPPDGSLFLFNLTLTAAQLPTAPDPLPASSFLSLLPIRLSPGARLLLFSVTIITPSCVSLALHQDLACRAAPTPSFTVTPNSLLVHSFATPSLYAKDVLLTCSGRQQPPPPCAAAAVRTGAELLREVWAWERQRDSPPVPLYLYVDGTVQLNPPAPSDTDASGNTADTQGSDPGDAGVWEEVRKVFPGSTMLPVSRGTVVLFGAPDRASVLQISGRGSLLDVQEPGAVRLQHLTLRGLPQGPTEMYPEALLRLPMWFATATKPSNESLLAVSNVTVELPPEELAFWRDVRGAKTKGSPEVAPPQAGNINGSEACITDSGTVFSSWQEFSEVPTCADCLLAKRLSTGGLLEIQDTLLVDADTVAAPPLPLVMAPPPSPQMPDARDALQLPPAPSNPLCALAPGTGMQEAELLRQLITDADTAAASGNPINALPAAFSWRPAQWPLPLMSQLSTVGLTGMLHPSDLFSMYGPNAVAQYGAMLPNDVKLTIRDSSLDDPSFLRVQAVVELPGMLLLGDVLGIRTLDLSGLPSAVVLEQEPLARSPSTWDRRDVLLPFLDTVRQQRQAAGLPGLLTEPVSLTVRHLVLINLPAAGPFLPIPPPPGAVYAGGAPPKGGSRRLLTESPERDGVGDVQIAGRALQQEPQSPSVDQSATGAGATAADADYLGGLPPSLTNLTSCLWSLQLDRAAVVRAVRDRLQQGGGGAGGSGGGVQSPVDVSYALLQSVHLVVPERELLLLAWAWATNATGHAARPGLAEQLQLMLDGSRLAEGEGALLQLIPQSPPGGLGGSAPALPPGLRLVFDQFVWCGLLGTNVTLTSQLPGPTTLSLQLPTLDLPVVYGTSFVLEPQGAPSSPEAPPPWVGLPPSHPPPTGPMAGGVVPTAGGSDEDGASGGGEKNGTVQWPTPAAAAPGGAGSGKSAPDLPLSAVVVLAVGCTAVLVAAAVGMGVWLVRRRRGQAGGADKFAPSLKASSAPAGTQSSDPRPPAGHHHHLSQQPHAPGRPPRAPRQPSSVLSHMVTLRLGVERKRQLVLGQQQEQQQLPAERHTLDTRWLSHCEGQDMVAGCTAGKTVSVAKEGGAGSVPRPSGSTLSSSLLSYGDGTGGGSSTSVPGAGPRVARAGSSSAARGEGDCGLGGLESAEVSCSGSTPGAAAGAEASRGFLGALRAAGKRGEEGSRARGGGGGGSSSVGNSSSRNGGPPLVLLRELGRGAQGVVYAGRWRGLDVAVKSVLVQRLGGSPNGGLWHGPSLHSALAEGSISTALSHPHVVATYETYIQGPEGQEKEVGAGEATMQAPAAAAADAVAALHSSRDLVGPSATAAAALEATRPEATAEVHVLHGGEGVGGAAVGAATAAGSRNSDNHDASDAQQQVPCPEHDPTNSTVQRDVMEHLGEALPDPAAARHSQAAQLVNPRASGAADGQVQVWKLTLVQELCTGGSLRDSLLAGRLARRGSGPWPRALHPAAALRLALHVARGSAHLHHHGVLWNDLSSANVLLQLGRQGGETGVGGNSSALDFVAKVADFGLSRRLPEGATHASETAGRSGLYVAPEVVRCGRCTPASDVYAYGVLLWEVAAGVPLPELLSQPESGAVRSWLAQQAFVPPEEVEALPTELLVWPGVEQQHRDGCGAVNGDGAEAGAGAHVGGDGGEGRLLPAGYVALAEQCLQQDPKQRPTFEEAGNQLACLFGPTGSEL